LIVPVRREGRIPEEGVMKRVFSPTAVVVCMLGAAGAFVRAQIQTPEGFPALGASPVLTIVSAGAEPRTPIRYAFSNGRTEHVSMDLTMGVSVDMGGMSMPAMQMPTMHTAADVAVTGVSPAGDASYTLAFTDLTWVNSAGVDPALLTALQSMGVDMKAVSGSATVNPRGVSRDVIFDTSKITNPQMAQMMGSMSTTAQSLTLPFPEEPLGPGAHWVARQTLAVNGMQTFQKTDVELVSRDATSCTVKTTLEQSAPAQTVSLPGLPPGTEASLEHMTGTGTGTTTIHFDSLVPTANGNIQTTVVMNVAMGGDTQRMTAQATVNLKVAPVK
jgi:hypothetical protein